MFQQFAKRRNPDGTMDSICLNCFRTVATCTDELELIELEKEHRCGQERAELAESRYGASILEFPPDRMNENQLRLEEEASAGDRAAKSTTRRQRIQSRKWRKSYSSASSLLTTPIWRPK